eukprot:gene6578-7634_t
MSSTTDNKYTVILTHGAWADASCWSKVIGHLNKAGHQVFAVQNHLETLDQDVENTRRLIERQKGPVLLVGHSYGGSIITETANKCPNVKGLVYVAAFAPDVGESSNFLLGQAPSEALQFASKDDYGRLWLDSTKFGKVFAQDATQEETDLMGAVENPVAFACFDAKIKDVGWKKVPTWYLISENDKTINPIVQQSMSKRIPNAVIKSIPASHASMVAHDKEVFDFISQALSKLGASACKPKQ